MRFLVGAAEAGFFSAVIVYLTHWFRYEDRAKAVAKFYAANPISYVVGSPLAGLLLGLSWLGLRGWRWLFILEGIPAIILGVIAVFYLTDWPKQARWLSSEERDWISDQLQSEKEKKKQRHSYSIWEALRQRDVVLLTLRYFFALTGGYGISFWLPTILKRLSEQSDLRVTILAALHIRVLANEMLATNLSLALGLPMPQVGSSNRQKISESTLVVRRFRVEAASNWDRCTWEARVLA